jgi:hypothetical protein
VAWLDDGFDAVEVLVEVERDELSERAQKDLYIGVVIEFGSVSPTVTQRHPACSAGPIPLVVC